MPPRPDVSDERRPQIIEAAIRVFSRKGYRKAAMPEIAREAGLSVGGVYWYFKGKEDLVIAILRQCFQSDQAALDALLNADLPAGAKARAFAQNYVENFTAYSWFNGISTEFYGEAAHDPLVRQHIQEYLSHYRLALVTLIEQGIRRGEFRPVNPQDAANAILGLEEGLAILLVADPGNLRWKESFQMGIELILAGLEQKQA